MAENPCPDPPKRTVRCAVITLSDTRTEADDKSGQIIQQRLQEADHPVGFYKILPDEPEQLKTLLLELAMQEDLEVVICNGGTGIAPRDTTFDALQTLLEKELPGFGELFRMLSWDQVGSRAMASRATCGIFKGKLIFSLPGSHKAVALAMDKLIVPEIVHLVRQLKGEH
jgi:molybdopterin adenylyltransferase